MPETSGLDLKVERTRARVRARDIASAMGVSASRVSLIEREQFPSVTTVTRYRAAIATCATSPTSSEAAA